MRFQQGPVLFWGFTTSDLRAVVHQFRASNPDTVWVGKDKACDFSIIDFYEYRIQRISALQDRPYSHIELDADAKNRVYSVLQREFMGWQSSHIDLHQLTGFFIDWYASLLTSRNIKLVWFGYIPHLGSELILYYVAQALGIPTRMFYQSLFKNKTFVINRIDDFGKIPAQAGAYGNFAEQVSFGSPEQDLFYMRHIPPVQKNLLWLFALLKDRLKKRIKGKTDQLGLVALTHMYQTRAGWMQQQAGYQWDNVKAESLDYVYFPLHMQPELTTDPLGGFYGDQAYAIEVLRKKLPDNVAIVIKENPKQTYEWRERDFFERIKRLPNTFFVNSGVNTYYLLKHAKAVATITGTAGWEGVLGGKPAIILGAAWYRDLPGVFDARLDSFSWQEVTGYTADFSLVAHQLNRLASHLPEAVTDMHYLAIYPEYSPEKNQQAILNIICGNG